MSDPSNLFRVYHCLKCGLRWPQHSRFEPKRPERCVYCWAPPARIAELPPEPYRRQTATESQERIA